MSISTAGKPLRVMHSHPVWLPQTQPWLYNLVRHLPESKVLSQVVCDRTENLEQFRVPRLQALDEARHWPYWTQRLLQRFQSRPSPRFLAAQGRRFGAELVHSHFGNIGWRDLPAVRRLRSPHVVSFYGFEIGRLPKHEPVWHTRYADMFATVDLVTCQGPYMAQSIVDLGCPPDKIRINRLGIETEHIAYRPRQWTPGEKMRVLIAAGFVEKKGIPSAVRALAKIKDEVPLEVTIIGDARAERQSQAEKQRILDAISESGLGERVRRLGFQPHRKMIEEAYRNHIFLSPSITASDGDTEAGTVLAIIEMIATGMPVVSTRHCDIPTTIEHGRTGFLAEEGDVEGIANGLRALIAEPGRWKAITDAARQHMERDFNAASQGVELAGLYAEVMARRAAAARSEA